MSVDKKNYVLGCLANKQEEYNKKKQSSRAYSFKRAFDALSSLSQIDFDTCIVDMDKLENVEGMTVKAAEFIKEILKDYKFYQAAQAQCSPGAANLSKNVPVISIETTNLDLIILEIQQNTKYKYSVSPKVDFRKLLFALHKGKIKSLVTLNPNNFLVECVM